MVLRDREADVEKIKALFSTYQYYEILGVDENASQKEVGAAINRFIVKYRPDSDIFKQVSSAISILHDFRLF